MTNSLIATQTVQVRGRIRAVVHTGHEFDAKGNVIKYGDVLRETPFGRNKITTNGFDKLLGGAGGEFSMVAGTGSTAPTESDTILTTYEGKCSTRISCTRTYNNNTASLPLWWRATYRVTFNPGSLGTGSKNIAEAGAIFGTALGSVNGSTVLAAHGLIVDVSDVPTPIAVNTDTEYLDLIWEYTEYLPYDATGTVSITVEGTPTNFTYYVRPANLTNTGGSYDTRAWQQPAATAFPGWGPTGAIAGYVNVDEASTVGNSALTTPDNIPMSTGYSATTYTSDAYTLGTKYRDFTMQFAPAAGNPVGGVNLARVALGHSQWQVSYSPALDKTATKQLTLTFRLAYANAA